MTRHSRPSIPYILGALILLSAACGKEETKPDEGDAELRDAPPLADAADARDAPATHTHDAGEPEVDAADEDSAVDEDTECPPGFFRDTPDGDCEANALTVEACAAAGGMALADPGDGSISIDGCPRRMHALGTIDAGWTEGGLCCQHTVESCAPQRVRPVGSCEPPPRYYWTGGWCAPLTACSCQGEDCGQGFGSAEECEQAFASCADLVHICGGLGGGPCEDHEFCAYRAAGACGILDAPAVCQPRPEVCDTVYDPVCGCDGNTYSNECSANMAGTGLMDFGECG